MTDLEMTRLCAEAMGIQLSSEPNVLGKWTYLIEGEGPFGQRYGAYDPLHDDAQAMALVKRIGLELIPPPLRAKRDWGCRFESIATHHANLNRAICECVARMQAAKEKP